jgi:hypothetical protein
MESINEAARKYIEFLKRVQYITDGHASHYQGVWEIRVSVVVRALCFKPEGSGFELNEVNECYLFT